MHTLTHTHTHLTCSVQCRYCLVHKLFVSLHGTTTGKHIKRVTCKMYAKNTSTPRKQLRTQLQILFLARQIHYSPGGLVIPLILRNQRACIRSKDRRCRARVTPARLPWRAHVACIPCLQERQSFSRMLLSQKSKTSRITSPTHQEGRGRYQKLLQHSTLQGPVIRRHAKFAERIINKCV